MRNNKGSVLLIVIVFMFLSQIVYLGMLRLNQSQTQRLNNFQRYYQAQSQAALTLRELNLNIKDRIEELELDINQFASGVMEQECPKKVDEWWYQDEYCGIGERNSKQIIIYVSKLYFSQENQNLVEFMQNKRVDGIVLRDNQLYERIDFDQSLSAQTKQVQSWIDELEKEGYQVTNDYQVGYRNVFQPKENLEGTNLYNTGETSYWIDNQELVLKSLINQEIFIKHIQLDQVDYFVQWHCYYLEK